MRKKRVMMTMGRAMTLRRIRIAMVMCVMLDLGMMAMRMRRVVAISMVVTAMGCDQDVGDG